ncbi:hypothetical protein C2G38_2256270, partial [Gigaspora rosea]
MVLNIDDYHSIHTERMPNTTTTSTAAHLATILLNPITTQEAIPQANVHNPKLVDAELIKTNVENKFMTLYGLSHNQRWGFRTVDDEQKLEELNVHNYDTRLKEKRHIRSIKDVILVDLQENNLHTMKEYIDAINTVVNVPSMQRYIEKGHIIPIVADWPGQIHIRTAISRYLLYHDLSNITNNTTVEEKFGLLYKDAEYLALKDLLDNSIPLVLDIYAVFDRKNYTKAPLMFLSDIFYWESINHPILEAIKAQLPKFSDSTVEIFHSFLRRSTQKHTEAQQIINYGRYLNQLRLDGNGFRENFAHTSTWAAYEYSARDISHLTKKCACFLLQCFLEIYVRVFHSKTPLTFSQSLSDSSSKKKGKKKYEESISLTAMKMPDAQLCHLPLGFNTSCKPDPFRYCDSSNCLVFFSNNPDPIRILACGHTYHESCYRNSGLKCLYCLASLQDGVDRHVQSLLERLKKSKKKKTKKQENTISCDDDDEYGS